MKVAIAILNWNGQGFLEKFLPSVIEYSSSETTAVYVIDNASTDNSVAFMHEHYPNISLIELDKNYGFAEGYNKGLQHINAEYFVLLNSDVQVTPHWIEPVISYMDTHKNCAAAMPKLLSYTNPEYFEYAGAAGGFIDRYGFPFCNGRLFTKVQKDSGQYNNIKEIFWASGAALFVRSSVYWQLGGLDADFFAHMEEIDLCWRMKNRGYSIMYIPQSTVYHVGGGALPASSPFKTYLNFRNNLYLLYKNLPRENFFGTLFTRMMLDGIAFAKFILAGKFADARSVFKAHRDFYKALPNLKKKRNTLQQYCKAIQHPHMYNKSIVWDFYVRRKKDIAM
ncbi:MAG: glycosyltransferase family 2 protein [Bacteroidales bacterium]|jgi:GT2 family glycosyltransferase|nr:glycosyltransferase family 2 protein [Bacteroidales bacterium]